MVLMIECLHVNIGYGSVLRFLKTERQGEYLMNEDRTGFQPDHRGKVRDIYDLGDRLLLIATDRASSFDVVLPGTIPGRGVILTKISKFWLEGPLADIVPNHLLSTNILDLPADFLMQFTSDEVDYLEGRIMIAKKAKVFPVECIVRGYLAGSGLKEYNNQGTVCGIVLPTGLVNSDKLPEPIFTPSTKAEAGSHDENITFGQMCRIVGESVAVELKRLSLELYNRAAEHALVRGVIIADTKFEFGIINDEIMLIDEVLTPDSSRFWPLDEYEPGREQNSFDKQILRNYLTGLKKQGLWNGEAPGPVISQEIVEQTIARYREVYGRITGHTYMV